ncbi:hypothetical protein NIES4106_55880 (plasmid) [Fischerella sp. NIES-4106]|nr:hypothetical protein NIES4106_55880 [Fischerella sp. NIES-4106]
MVSIQNLNNDPILEWLAQDSGQTCGMTQILDFLSFDQPHKILCSYVNVTNQIQIARIANVPNWYFERVIFPGQGLLFEAPVDGQLEINTGMEICAILSDTILCNRLRIN